MYRRMALRSNCGTRIRPRQEELLNIGLFCGTAYERPFYDGSMVRGQIAAYPNFISLLSRPQLRAATPEIDWAFHVCFVYLYLSSVYAFLFWEKRPRISPWC